MRVLEVVPSLASRRGGPSSVLLALAPALAEAGVDVRIVSTTAGLDEAAARALSVRLSPARLTLVPIVGPERIELSPAILGALRREIADCDLVHLHTVFTFPVVAAALLAARAGRPYIVRPAGTLDEVCLRQRSYVAKRVALATWVGRMLDGAAVVQATSSLERRELARWVAPGRIREVALGADPSGAAVDDGAPGTRLASVGRLHPIKGLERLLAALALLPPTVTLELAGDGDPAYVQRLRAQAAALGLGERVRFLGHVDEQARAALLARVELCVFPSRHESFGVAVVEAMAAGRAVVVSEAVGIAGEIVAAGAGRVAPADAAGLAAVVNGLLSDGAARARAGGAGRALAEGRYSWRAAAERTRALYEDVLR